MPLLISILAACGYPVGPGPSQETDDSGTLPVDTADTAPTETGDTDTSTTTPPTPAQIAAANDKDTDYFLDGNISGEDLEAILQSNDAELLRAYHYNNTAEEFYFDCDDTDAVQNAWQRNNGVETDCDDDVNPTDNDALIIDVGYYSGVQGGIAKVFGDFDGDGLEDLAIGSGWEGAVYVFLGKSGLISHPGHLNAQADADVVFQDTTSTGTGFGSALKKVDLNGDGKDDLLVGASSLNSLGAGDNTNSGGAVGIYGRESFTDVSFDNSDLMDDTWVGAQQMFTIKGWTNSSSGDFLHLLGDIDGKGNQQIVLGDPAYCYAVPALAYTGVQQIDSLYNYYLTGTGNLTGVPTWDADGNRVADYGAHYFRNTDGSPDQGNFCEHMVSGDFTRDGIDELVVADSIDFQNDGRGNVVVSEGGTLPREINFFRPTFTPFYLRGNGAGYGAGEPIAINDVDGDGYPDLGIGVPSEGHTRGDVGGTIYLTPGISLASIFDGTNDRFGIPSEDNPQADNDADLDGDVTLLHGIRFYEPNIDAFFGFGFTMDSDSDGDGITDLTAGASAYGNADGDESTSGGRAYHFNSGPLSEITQKETALTEEESNVSTEEADGTIASDGTVNLGSYVVGNGDLDGDGTGEVAMSDVSYNDSRGRVQVYFGGRSE